MPSENPFTSPRDTVRSHPVIVASWAATAGLLLGGFVTLKVLAPEPAAKIGTVQAAVETKPAPKPVAETTGSAPSEQAVASSTDCDHQTWPNLSRVCMEAMRGKNCPPRVVSTDKLDQRTVSAIEFLRRSLRPALR